MRVGGTVAAHVMTERTRIFIAYCFAEKRWRDRLLAALEPAAGKDRFIIWDESMFRVNPAWKTELTTALAMSKVGVMIVSDLFLESDFMSVARLPGRLERERKSGLEVCWVLARQCLFEQAGLKEADAGNHINAALDGLGSARRDAEVAEIVRKIAGYLGVDPAPAPMAALPAAKAAIPSAQLLPAKRRKLAAGAGQAESAVLQLQPLPERRSRSATAPSPHGDGGAPCPPPPVPAEPAASTIATSEVAALADTRVLESLDVTIQTRQTALRSLGRLARWLLLAALLLALASIPMWTALGFSHFVFVAGFAVFVAAQALRLRARASYLGQCLIGLRYTRGALADESLPSRQREPLLRKAEETLGVSRVSSHPR